jgi:N-acetylglucosamine-6-phosphate deacetylase
MSAGKIYTAPRIFTGEKWLNDHSVVTGNGAIEKIIPAASLTPDDAQEVFEDCIMAPAFIDLQIYGAGGKLLAACPEADALYKLNEYCNRGGAAFCLPTVATNTKETVFKCIDAVRDYRSRGGSGVLGLHLEGPWINPLKRGAHVEALIHPPTQEEVQDYLRYGKDCIKMITLAPELCTKEIIELILSHNIILSAGHSNATYAEAQEGFANGIRAVTHLYNAMSPLQHRAPGLAGAAMDDGQVMASIIPDGHHVDFAAVRIAKKVMQHRLFVITDAVTDTTAGYYQHQLKGDKYEANDILSGSALTMNKAVQNLVLHQVAPLDEALRMCSLYPATLMNMHHQYGKIETGYAACMVVLDSQFNVRRLLLE